MRWDGRWEMIKEMIEEIKNEMVNGRLWVRFMRWDGEWENSSFSLFLKTFIFVIISNSWIIKSHSIKNHTKSNILKWDLLKMRSEKWDGKWEMGDDILWDITW